MGFFSKIFKGVKKVFKKIGKGIKGAFKGIGKFMNKIGIVGQIALMFVPGIGPMLNGMLKGLGGMAATALGSMGTVGNAILKGAQFVIGKAGEFAGGVNNTFRTVTQGVKTFASEFTKTGLNKLGFDPTKFGFKAGGSFDNWVKSGADQTFGDAWSKVTTNITDNASKILDPFKKTLVADSNATLDSLSDSTFKPVDEIKQLNPQIQNWDDISGKAINLDPDNVSKVFGAGPLQSTADTAMAAQQAQPSLLDKLELKETPTGSLTYDPQLKDMGFTPDLTTTLTPTGDTPSYLDSLTDIKTQTLQDQSFRMKGVTDTGGGSLLGMPSLGTAATQVGVNVASEMAMGALAGDPPAYSQGYLVESPYTQVYGASTPNDYMQAAASPYLGYRDQGGSFGHGSGINNVYANYLQRFGIA
tara:strand:+ start:307 stop:1551 length:1245 start_codon:yes stop_codon:yes gene_type:complete